MSNQKLKQVFKVDAVELAVVRPNPKVWQNAQKVYNRAFRDAAESGALLRAKAERVIREQGVWDEAREKEYRDAQKRVADGEKSLAKGGIRLTQAREIAIQMRRDRNLLRDLTSERNQIDQHTAEAQAENSRFNYLVSACTVTNADGKPVYKDLDDYLARNSEPMALEAAGKLAMMLYGLDNDFERKLPENKLLLKFGFCNQDLHLVNSDGHLVDSKGRLVDENGRFVDAEGKFVDAEGNRVTLEGDFVPEESQPFLDDEDKPIGEPEEEQPEADSV